MKYSLILILFISQICRSQIREVYNIDSMILKNQIEDWKIDSNTKSDNLVVQNPAFTSMIIGTDNLYALDKYGRYFIWNLNSLKKIYVNTDTTVKYTAIAKGNDNEIYLGTDKGKIFRLNTSDFSTSTYIQLKKELPVSNIFFNSSNEIFLIIPYAIYNPISDKYWDDFKHKPNGMKVQKKFLFFFRKRTCTYFYMPQYTFIDSRDRIWMTKNFGEFGGSVQIFDTKAKKTINADFDGLDFGSFFPRSVFEDENQNIYLTSGLQHFINFGKIYKIENKTALLILNGEDFGDTLNMGVFIGPGAYNRKDRKIYFATTEGIYRSGIPADGKIRNPELIIKPELIWEREPLAIGVGMTIKKIDFANDNRLVFLTSNNGIGIYDGKKLNMLK